MKSSTAISAPGTPIGGIIVKGGKNPGGQMRAMATTDAAGKFRNRFVEGGEIRGELQALVAGEVAAARAINQAGVSATPSKPKGGIKK